MWVPRRPLQADFCGCPPCPLCFDWTEREGEPILSGLKKFTKDMLGGKRPSKRELETLKDSAQRIHVGNLERLQQSDVERGVEVFHAADLAQRLTRTLRAAANDKAKQCAASKSQQLPVLDHIDLSKIERTEETVRRETWTPSISSEEIFQQAIMMKREAMKQLEDRRRRLEEGAYIGWERPWRMP